MSDQFSQIGTNLMDVRHQIDDVIEAVHRISGSVKLIVVTKGQPVVKMQALINSGGLFLGENYPEETAEKIESLTGIENIEWHMIGHVQSRKIKYLVKYFDVIESIESLETAQKVNARFLESGRKVQILLEVNVSGEVTKQGFAMSEEQNWNQMVDVIHAIELLPALKSTGLMTMPPLGETPESSRKYFIRLRNLLDFVNLHKQGQPLRELSMGTSFDYKIAIEEGATIVRVGEAIMGARNSS